MQAGVLDRRITLSRAAYVPDETGQVVATWSDFATVWASWRRASARETMAAAEVTAAISDVFVIRYSSDVTSLNAKDELRYNGRTYQIVEVTEIGRREGLRIAAVARAE